MSRRTLLTAAVLVAVFIAGAMAGAAVVRFAGWGASDRTLVRVQADRDRPDGPPGDRAERDGPGDRDRGPYALARYLEEELDLGEEQQERVQEILLRRQQEAQEMFRESRQRFESHLDSTMSEVREVLSAEQEEEFEELIERMRERRRDDR